jgi:hypothetical protein
VVLRQIRRLGLDCILPIKGRKLRHIAFGYLGENELHFGFLAEAKANPLVLK